MQNPGGTCPQCPRFLRLSQGDNKLHDLFLTFSSTGHIPILSSLAETNDGHMIHVCPMRATDELAAHFKPLKVMYLNSKGGILNEKGRVIEQVNFPTDYITATSLPWCDNRIYAKLGDINNLLKKLPFTSSAVITSADSVLQELFTHKGKVPCARIKDCFRYVQIYSPIEKIFFRRWSQKVTRLDPKQNK